MGHSRASKAATRARLVATAAKRFKEHGVDGISLSDLMKELDLTHGGFYKHFSSRDELVAEALDRALRDSEEALRANLLADGKPNLAGFLKFYLGEGHRDALAEGCAVAALSGDATREGPAVQAQFLDQIQRNIEIVSAALGGREGRERHEDAILILSTVYGALTMARAVGDSALSREILRTARERVLAWAAPEKKSTGRERTRTAANAAKPVNYKH